MERDPRHPEPHWREETNYAVTQPNGQPLALFSPEGERTWRQGQHSLWGLRLTSRWTRQQTSPLDPNLLFAGQYYDEESQLAYNRFRYYDPETGSYLTSDPIGLNGGEQPYRYTQNPMDWVDVFGLAGCSAKLSPAQQAAGWQGSGKYPGVDKWTDTRLLPGTKVVGGLPGQSEYYTTMEGLMSTGIDKVKLWEGLQVAPHPIHGYRGQVGVYEVITSTPAATASTLANPQFGKGGLPQIFVPDYKTNLKLLEVIDLK